MYFDNQEYKEKFWHTSAHLLAYAVQELFPNAKLAIGPAIADGFYYDFDVEAPFSPSDLVAIENKMYELVKEKIPVIHETWTKEQAESFFKAKNQFYKLELIDGINDAEVSVFTIGKFTDLCKGPHLDNISEIKAISLTSVAGAYWRGDEKRQMLQRIYGIAFPSKKELDEYLAWLEDAKSRDHRALLKNLDLGSFHDEVGPGLMIWHPKGAQIRYEIENFWRNEHYKNGYNLVFSPHIGKSVLWETSGHLSFYRDSMYPHMEIDENDYFIKPMNCPFHILVYKNATRSYRELPMRLAELGTVYRFERSGTLHGLLRVRGFTQDDAHIFCREDEMPKELKRTLEFCIYMLNSFGFHDFHMYVSTRPQEKCVGEESLWKAAQDALISVVKELNLKYDVDEGGGAFYGPKIDVKIKDVLGREWQCSTIQFDFNLPERFDLTYIAEDGKAHRPYVIHRALFGAIERFFAILLENCGGNFPLWLAPEQIKIVPIKDQHLDYSKNLCEKLFMRNLRASVDETSRPMGAKIREAKLEKIPYTIVIGDKEIETGTVALRLRDGRQIPAINIDDCINKLCEERDLRAVTSIYDAEAKN